MKKGFFFFDGESPLHACFILTLCVLCRYMSIGVSKTAVPRNASHQQPASFDSITKTKPLGFNHFSSNIPFERSCFNFPFCLDDTEKAFHIFVLMYTERTSNASSNQLVSIECVGWMCRRAYDRQCDILNYEYVSLLNGEPIRWRNTHTLVRARSHIHVRVRSQLESKYINIDDIQRQS